MARSIFEASTSTQENDRRSTDPVDMYVGSKIREVRRFRLVSQVQLAESVGLPQQQIHKYETAKSRISAATLYLVAQRLGVPVDVFFEGCQEAQPASLIWWEQIRPSVRKAVMEFYDCLPKRSRRGRRPASLDVRRA